MVSNQLSIYNMLTFIYQIYQVMPAPPQFPDVVPKVMLQNVATENDMLQRVILARRDTIERCEKISAARRLIY